MSFKVPLGTLKLRNNKKNPASPKGLAGFFNITKSGEQTAQAFLRPVSVKTPFLVDTLERMRTEEVPLRLHEIRRQLFRPVAIEISHSR